MNSGNENLLPNRHRASIDALRYCFWNGLQREVDCRTLDGFAASSPGDYPTGKMFESKGREAPHLVGAPLAVESDEFLINISHVETLE